MINNSTLFITFVTVLLLDQDSSHLPGRHLSVVGVGVVVPLDGGQVGVVREEDRLYQTLALLAPEAGRDGDVAELVEDLVRLAVDRILTTDQLASVSIIKLHAEPF